MLLTSFDLSVRMHYLNARQTLRRLLEWRAVPVVNENDTTATDEITFGDNDFLSAQLAILLEARLLVLLTDTDGLHTADPRATRGGAGGGGRAFAELERYEIGDRTSAYGSGGMRSKVAAAEMASAAGIPAVVCDGNAAGELLAAARGERVGTRFAPHPERTPTFKLWLRYAKPSRGGVVVDEGAARVLRERGSSLLPVGIVGVEGEFAAGDAVEVVCDGELVGKGIVNYSAAELGADQGAAVGGGARADAKRLRGGRTSRPVRADLGRPRQRLEALVELDAGRVEREGDHVVLADQHRRLDQLASRRTRAARASQVASEMSGVVVQLVDGAHKRCLVVGPAGRRPGSRPRGRSPRARFPSATAMRTCWPHSYEERQRTAVRRIRSSRSRGGSVPPTSR